MRENGPKTRSMKTVEIGQLGSLILEDEHLTISLFVNVRMILVS